MGSPDGRRPAGSIWDAVQLAEARAVRDFLHTPAVRALGPSSGEGGDRAREHAAPKRAARAPSPVIAPEVAAKIRARRAGGATYVAIAHELHMTLGEVAAVLCGWPQ
jgi:hypothetical protein